MEVAVYGAITVIAWISSATFLLPFLILLKCSKFCRDKWFTLVFERWMGPIFQPKILPLRKRAFELLKKDLSERDASNALKVLEIGIGSGPNLQFYPENSHLTALDMNPNFDSYFYPNQKKYPQIVYERRVAAFAEDMKEVDDCSMDVVISTYVLCSVSSISDVLKEVKRVLKPGGRFLFLEHVTYPRSYWSYTVQQMANPLWKIYCNGCSLSKNTGHDIKNAGFSSVSCEHFFVDFLNLFVKPQVCGIATK